MTRPACRRRREEISNRKCLFHIRKANKTHKATIIFLAIIFIVSQQKQGFPAAFGKKPSVKHASRTHQQARHHLQASSSSPSASSANLSLTAGRSCIQFTREFALVYWEACRHHIHVRVNVHVGLLIACLAPGVTEAYR